MAAGHSSGHVRYAPTAGAPLDPTFVARETGPAEAPKPRLLDRVREAIRARHYSRRTENAYVDWIKRYIFFHHKRHPKEMGAAEVTPFLTSLADNAGARQSARLGGPALARSATPHNTVPAISRSAGSTRKRWSASSA